MADDHSQSEEYSDILKSLQEMGVDAESDAAAQAVELDAQKFDVAMENGKYVIKPKMAPGEEEPDEDEDPTKKKPPVKGDTPGIPPQMEKWMAERKAAEDKQMEVLTSMAKKLGEHNDAIAALQKGDEDAEGEGQQAAQAAPKGQEAAAQQQQQQQQGGDDQEDFEEWEDGAGAAAIIEARRRGHL